MVSFHSNSENFVEELKNGTIQEFGIVQEDSISILQMHLDKNNDDGCYDIVLRELRVYKNSTAKYHNHTYWAWEISELFDVSEIESFWEYICKGWQKNTSFGHVPGIEYLYDYRNFHEVYGDNFEKFSRIYRPLNNLWAIKYEKYAVA